MNWTTHTPAETEPLVLPPAATAAATATTTRTTTHTTTRTTRSRCTSTSSRNSRSIYRLFVLAIVFCLLQQLTLISDSWKRVYFTNNTVLPLTTSVTAPTTRNHNHNNNNNNMRIATRRSKEEKKEKEAAGGIDSSRNNENKRIRIKTDTNDENDDDDDEHSETDPSASVAASDEVETVVVLNADASTTDDDHHSDSQSQSHTIQRALVTICMGDSAIQSNYVERFVWSARNIGQFTGWIVILTDAPTTRYHNLGTVTKATNSSLSTDDDEEIHNKVVVLSPEEHHYIRPYEKGPAMVYKQFKTYVLEYLAQDVRLAAIQLVYYLDVDIVFGNRLQPLFDELEPKYHIRRRPQQHPNAAATETSTSTSTSIQSAVPKMWMFAGNYKHTKIQGGQMILDRLTSGPCLERFRALLDPKTSTVDQVHLMKMLDEQTRAKRRGEYAQLQCEIVIMPQHDHQILFPTFAYMKAIADRTTHSSSSSREDDTTTIPILNHIKNTGGDLKKLSPEDFEAYLRYILRFNEDQEDTLGITKKTYLDGGQRKKGGTPQKQIPDYDGRGNRMGPGNNTGKEDTTIHTTVDQNNNDDNNNSNTITNVEEDGIEQEVDSNQIVNDDNLQDVRNDTTINDDHNGDDDDDDDDNDDDDNDNDDDGDDDDDDDDDIHNAVLDIRHGKGAVSAKMKELDYNDDVERAFVVVSMGEKAAKTKTVERFVYSARNAGQYNSWIVILTDAQSDRYAGLSNWTDNVIIMKPNQEDVKTHYTVSSMIYKRFKTLVLDYINKDRRLDDVEVVYYLDVDIVFGSSMWPAFHGIEETYKIGPRWYTSPNTTTMTTMTTTTPQKNQNQNVVHDNTTVILPTPLGKMWMFKGNSDKWQIQGGQIVLDRSRSSPCLELWRNKFDEERTTTMAKDQDLLMEMLRTQQDAKNVPLQQYLQQEQNTSAHHDSINGWDSGSSSSISSSSSSMYSYDCEIVRMRQYPYVEFPTVVEIKKRSNFLRKHPKRQYPTAPMVHVRNDGGTATMKPRNIEPYMANLLRFKRKQTDTLGILKKVQMDTT